MRASTMTLPVVQLPLLNLSTHPFDLLLAGLGLRMIQLAYTSPEFKTILENRSFTIQIESQDGIARNFTVLNNQVTMASGLAPKPDFTLRFKDGETAIQILKQGNPAAFMTGMQDGSVQMEGDFSLLMWFNQASKMIVPKIPKPILAKVKPALKHARKLQSRFTRARSA
ncbi:SCP-2 sterol transfer family protein [Aquirhabdus parva]|uniref:SCP-2 sterol transfer family protein n=2 Tax=Aquirhabdus parva TaxID=2283318 RepID=A0A345P836_9GAMM|nr:SCP-2 sterol transfer family protein [Aquirhabdus parva]AXI03445.1 SCP-2 sterol transfer family protein [Aquirhabdus parva]